MKRRTIILLGLAALVVAAGYFLWSGFRQAMWAHHLIHGDRSVQHVEHWGMEGPQEDALEYVIVNDRAAGLATIHLLGGTAAVDGALRAAFGRPSPAHPLPSPERIDHARYRKPQEVISTEDEYGRSVQLVAQGHGWLVDLRPLEVRGLKVEEAAVMRERMMAFAERVRAGDFATFGEAIAAYESSGLWDGFRQR